MAAARDQTRLAVESLAMAPVMFETVPASAEGSRRELLDRLAECDLVILLLGAEYGEPAARGISPTEEEFDHAVSNGVPVLALVQDDVERESAQSKFLGRVRGTWEEGGFTGRFVCAQDVGLAVVRALNDWKERQGRSDATGAAARLAVDLASADARRGHGQYDAQLRTVIVPTLDRPLLDAVSLGDAGLPDNIGMLMRMSGLVGNEIGLTAAVLERRIVVSSREQEVPRGFVTPTGGVVVEVSVASQGMMGGSILEGPRVRDAISRALSFANRVWGRIDQRDEVRDCLAMTAVPEPAQKTFSDETHTGNRITMGSMSTGPVLLAPQQPIQFRRADLERAETTNRLYAETRQAFADIGSLQ